VDSTNAETALPIRWAAHLMKRKSLPRERINLALFGMCTEPGQKKAYFYAQETFNAPAAYLQDSLKLGDLENGLTQAEAVRRDLYVAAKELARYILVPQHDLESGREPGSDDYGALIQHWNPEAQYWRLIEPAFYRLLTNLPESDEAMAAWQEDLRQAARSALDYAARQAGTDAAGLKARAKAEKTLNIRLHQTFTSTE
jgi:hypothetical protein